MHLFPMRLIIGILLHLVLHGHVQSMKAEQWKKRSIYQVLTDRFAPTDLAAEATACDPKERIYCGGTWQGIIRRLDYIQGMGFDAIWISPITKQIDDDTIYGQAYHGYWQQDIFSCNPQFGQASDLLALSQALHARGMVLMVDVVVNHFGSSTNIDFSSYVPFNDGSYFHQEQFITDYNNQSAVEQGWLGNSMVPLPDVNTENATVVSTFYNWISTLVQTFQIDGLRLDTVKHVRKDFWPGFVSSSGVFALGEVLSGDPNYLSAYQPFVGGLLDYGTYYPLLRSFAPGGNMGELMSLIAPSYRALFQNTQLLATFMENHDMPRFTYSTSTDLTIVKSAMAYTLLSDGIPIIYYGQEQSFQGAGDPENREPMWQSGFQITALYRYIASLNKARALAWDAGFGTNLSTGLYVDASTTITQKGPLLLVLSNQGSGAPNKTVTFSPQFAPTTVLVNILTCSSLVVGKSQTNVTIVAGSPQIYLPLGLAQQMCSNIIAPTQTSTIMSKLSSLFTSSTKAAQKSISLSSLAVYKSGRPTVITSALSSSQLSASPSSSFLKPSTTQSNSPYSLFSSSSQVVVGRPSVQTSPVSTTTSRSARPVVQTSVYSASSSKQTSASSDNSASRAGMKTQGADTSPSSISTPSSASARRTITTPSSTGSTTRTGRPVVTTTSPNSGLQKRHFSPGSSKQPVANSHVQNRGNIANGSTSSQSGQRKLQQTRQTNAPPASLSQHYREDRLAPPFASSQHGLSSMYSYSSSHLPVPRPKLSQSSRSNSDNNLDHRGHNAYVQGHTAQSQSLHTLRKRPSAQSLSVGTRSNSFGGSVPPVPKLSSRLDTRAALFDDNAPYAHTFSLSSSSLAAPSPKNMRSRRSSNASIRSGYSGYPFDPAARKRNASEERQNLLSQENGVSMSYLKPGFVDPSSVQTRADHIMGDARYDRSKTSLLSPSSTGDPTAITSPQQLSNTRRHDRKAQIQQELRRTHV